MLLWEVFVAACEIQYAAPNVTSHALRKQKHERSGSAKHQGSTSKTLLIAFFDHLWKQLSNDVLFQPPQILFLPLSKQEETLLSV